MSGSAQAGASPAAKILIVEDEFLVALQLEDMLIDAGYCVIGIVSDRASLDLISDAPQVALVDLNLRDGPSGAVIAFDLANKHGTKVLYVTANPQQIGNPVSTAIGVIQKPFSESAILTAIDRAVGNGERGLRPSEIDRLQPTRH